MRHFLAVKTLVVLPRRQANGVVLREERLNQDATGRTPPSRSPRGLRQELEGALGGTEVGQAKSLVNGHNANQGDAGKVVPLRNQLRSDEDINLAQAEL
jgi:hypothetical protein